MLLNKENFITYPDDTQDSIELRIAAKLNTTLEWLFIVKNCNDNNNIRAFDMFKYISDNFIDFYSFEDIESNTLIYEWSLVDQEAFFKSAKLYISLFYKKEVDSGYFINNTFTAQNLFTNFFLSYDFSEFDFEFIIDIIDNSDFFFESRKSDIEETKRLAKESENILVNIQRNNFSYNIDVSEWKLTHIVTSLNIETKENIIMESILNNISNAIEMLHSMNSEYKFLFAHYKNFIKISDKYFNIISEYEYEFPEEDEMVIILFSENFSSKNKEKSVIARSFNFREIIIKQNELKNFHISIDIDKEISKEDISIILNTPLVFVQSTDKTRLTGKFILYNNSFDKNLLLDLIMNDKRFQNIYHNERRKVSKAFAKLQLIYTSDITGKIIFKLLNVDGNIEITISKAQSMEIVNLLNEKIIFLIQEYNYFKNEIYEIYKNELTNFILEEPFNNVIQDNKKQKKNKSSTSRLAELEPSIFLPLYSRKCAKPPTIVEEPPSNFQAMQFPLYGEGGKKPRYYICNNSENFKYPGLRQNSLSNKNIFPYIPCCYETNQVGRIGSGLTAYIENKPKGNFERYDVSIYKTSRILSNNNKGILPEGIIKLIGNSSLRQGVYIGPNAFIDCIIRSISDIKYHDNLSQNKYQKLLSSIRSKLSYEICLQENSDIKDRKLLKEWFYNSNLYFEPRRFYRSLEEYFRVNIYFFERSPDHVYSIQKDENNDISLNFVKTQTPNGVLGLPNLPIRGVYVMKPMFPTTVYVYVHMGSSIDSLDFPHVEYIHTFEDNSDLVEKIFTNMIGYYIPEEELKLDDSKKLSGQIVDESGHTRVLIFKKDNLITYKKLDFPHSPFNSPLIEEIIDEEEIKTSEFENFIYMKRFARLFVEYCMIKYSIWVQNKLNLDLSNKFVIPPQLNKFVYLDIFFEENSIIEPNKKYDKFTDENIKVSFFDNIFLDKISRKIVFDSIDTKERIKFSLRIFEKRFGIKNFINRTSLKTYFLNTIDFKDKYMFTEKSFKEIIYNTKQGELFNNILKYSSSELIIILDMKNYFLNGYFIAFSNLEAAKSFTDNEYTTGISKDIWYFWDKNEWKVILSNIISTKSRVYVVYKIKGVIQILVKTFHLENKKIDYI